MVVVVRGDRWERLTGDAACMAESKAVQLLTIKCTHKRHSLHEAGSTFCSIVIPTTACRQYVESKYTDVLLLLLLLFLLTHPKPNSRLIATP
jgi:hypothetical protein